MKMMD